MIDVSVEKVSPDAAAKLLALNTSNFRKPDHRRVNAYAKEMLAGRWELNGDTIKVNGSVLIDGQHRLMAILKSGVTVDMVVVRGIESDGKTIDRGKPRSIGQWLSHSGIKNATSVASTAKMCVFYKKGLWSRPTMQGWDVSDSEIFSFVEQYQEKLSDCVKLGSTAGKVIPASLLATVLFYGSGASNPQDVSLCTWFAGSLAKGESLTDEDAVFHLRNRLLSQTSQASMDRFMQRALLTMAWNKTVKGEPCTAMHLRLRVTGPVKQKAPETILDATAGG